MQLSPQAPWLSNQMPSSRRPSASKTWAMVTLGGLLMTTRILLQKPQISSFRVKMLTRNAKGISYSLLSLLAVIAHSHQHSISVWWTDAQWTSQYGLLWKEDHRWKVIYKEELSWKYSFSFSFPFACSVFHFSFRLLRCLKCSTIFWERNFLRKN